MNDSNRLRRSVGAVIVGALVGIVLSIATDLLLHAAGLLPAPPQPASSSILALATVYRTIYGILGSYICARLAPLLPMRHSIILGCLGLAASVAGAAVTWNKGPAFGPHWYPLALIILALPTAWLGAKIFIARQRSSAAV